MAEQDIQHSTNNTPTQSDIHVETWKGKQRRHICTLVHTRTHTRKSEFAWLIQTRISQGNRWSNVPQTNTSTLSQTHEQANRTTCVLKGILRRLRTWWQQKKKKAKRKYSKSTLRQLPLLLLLPSVCVIDRLSRFHRDESAFSSSHLFSLQGN